jgi:GT2 family glycosyltransferase
LKELSIIIVNWNVCALLRQCLRSIYVTRGRLALEVIVVDNASCDDSVRMVRSEFPEVQLIASDTNLGFPKAVNQAIPLCKGDFVLFLNPDTVVQPGTLEKSVNFLQKHAEFGVLGCKLLYEDGRVQYEGARNFPALWAIFLERMYLHMLFPRSRFFALSDMGHWDHDDDREVPAISGAFMLLRRAALQEVAPLDELMFFEDIDLCYRLRAAGWRIYYLASAVTTHFSGKSCEQSEADLWLLSGEVRYRFFRKHKGVLQAETCRLIFLFGSMFRLILGLVLYPVVVPFSHRSRFGRLFNLRQHIGLILWSLGLAAPVLGR